MDVAKDFSKFVIIFSVRGNAEQFGEVDQTSVAYHVGDVSLKK